MDGFKARVLLDSQIIASRRRFGLFSQPPPLALCDDGQYQNKKHFRGQDGKPITAPRQMLAGQCRSGILKRSYLDVPSSINIKDKYRSEYKREMQYNRKNHTKASFHKLQFKPASSNTTLKGSAYKYREQVPKEKIFPERDQTGKVKTNKPNVLTNKLSTIQTNLFKNPIYIEDQYQRQKELRNKQRQRNKKKVLDSSFRSMSFGNRTFSSDKSVYGQDEKSKSISLRKKTHSTLEFRKNLHKPAFRPTQKSYGQTFGKYPKFVERKRELLKDPLGETEKGKQKKEGWKSSLGLSRPTPSISFHAKNINIGKH